MNRFEASCTVSVPQETLFAYHAAPGALQRLLPPWQNVRIASSDQSLRPGSTVVLELSAAGFPVRWVAVHGRCDPPNFFEDFQESGPFAHWHHRHHFSSGATLRDQIDYRVRGGAAGSLATSWINRQLDAMFRYRHRVTRDDLMMFNAYQLPPQRIAVSGASGLVGAELCNLLTLGGHRVSHLVRDIQQATPDRPAAEQQQQTAPDQAAHRGEITKHKGEITKHKGEITKHKGEITKIAPWHSQQQAERLAGADAVVHLAGKSIASGRWTARMKQEIHDSRVIKTRELCQSLAALTDRPKTLVCASAIGIYGDRGNERLDETSKPGDDFLATVAQQWEQACRPAEEAGIRVVNLRFGIILSPRGGALAKMLLPAKLALGGPLGSGTQWWSWIGIDDAIGAIYHVLASPALSGPVNVVAPEPVTNAQFAQALGKVLYRPALLPAPAPVLRAVLGEMAGPLLLASARAEPTKLLDTQYRFRFRGLRECFKHLLGQAR